MSEPGRLLFAIGISLAFTGLYILGLYLFYAAVWPALPDWAKAIAFILLAVFAIGSPIAALARFSGMPPRKRPPDSEDGTD